MKIRENMNVIEKLAELEHKQWQTWAKVRNPEHPLVDVPYFELTEEDKEKDRDWAEKVLEIIPCRCPIWQCGGFMYPTNDSQTPTLVCSNCHGVYKFERFKT